MGLVPDMTNRGKLESLKTEKQPEKTKKTLTIRFSVIILE
jgi:hypothetical protein